MTQVVGRLQWREMVHHLPAHAGPEGCSPMLGALTQLRAEVSDGQKRLGEGNVVLRPVEVEELDMLPHEAQVAERGAEEDVNSMGGKLGGWKVETAPGPPVSEPTFKDVNRLAHGVDGRIGNKGDLVRGAFIGIAQSIPDEARAISNNTSNSLHSVADEAPLGFLLGSRI